MGRNFSDELELPETVFVRDIDDRVFQAVVLHSLERIEGIELSEGGLLDHWLGRPEKIKGVNVTQNDKSSAVSVRVEVNICYGVSIPQKAEEIQAKVAEEITRMTGLHVDRVHVVFKGMVVEGKRTPIEEVEEIK